MYTTSQHAKQDKKNSICEFIYLYNLNYDSAYQVNIYFKLPEAVIHNASIIDDNIKTAKYWHCCLEWFWKQYHWSFLTSAFFVFLVLSYFHDSSTVRLRTYLHIVDNPWHHTGKRLPCLCHILLTAAEPTALQPLYWYHKLKPTAPRGVVKYQNPFQSDGGNLRKNIKSQKKWSLWFCESYGQDVNGYALTWFKPECDNNVVNKTYVAE